MRDHRLRDTIFRVGLTQRQVAKRARLSPALLSMGIRGKYRFNGHQRQRIAEVIGKPENEVFSCFRVDS